MSDERKRVLIVDDSPVDLQMVMSCIKNDYQVIAATNGQDALNLLQTSKVEVVLLDVTMPDMDGYQVCAKIRETNQHLQIIFLSANDGLDEILKGYDVGGNDYVTKPFSPEILLSKIAKAAEFVSHYEQLETEKNDASGAFMTAITSMGDLGGVINFLRSSFKVSESEDLAGLLLDAITNYELSGCVQLRSEYSTKNFSNNNDVSPLETELLTRIANMNERFVENGKRMFINFPKVSVLIKNMPIDDDMKMGRLRDTLAILIEGTNEKQMSIEKDQTMIAMLEVSSKTNMSILKETQEALTFIKTVHEELKHSNLSLMDSTTELIQNTFINLGLTERQEAALSTMLRNSLNEAKCLFDESAELEEQIGSILNKLNIKP
jgi:CheY-like chemotaxis protein